MAIVKEIERMQQSVADPRRLARALDDVIDGANNVIETAPAWRSHAQAREQASARPRPPDRQEHHGQLHQEGQRHAVLGALDMFNANLQGNARMIGAIRTAAGRRSTGALQPQALGDGHAPTGCWAAAMMRAARGATRLVPQWERERTGSCSSPGTDSYIRCRCRWGPTMLFNAGRALAEIGTQGVDPIDTAASFLASTVGAFNPVGGGLPSMDVRG